MTQIGGSVTGIGTQNWSITGSIGLGFGQQFPVKGQYYRIVAAYGAFTANKDELILSGGVGIGAAISCGRPDQLAVRHDRDRAGHARLGRPTFTRST